MSALIGELSWIIQGGEVLEWHRRPFNDDFAFMKDRAVDNLCTIKGVAMRPYAWLLIRQEELTRNTKGPRLEVSNKEFATGIGVAKTTAQNYRALLAEYKIIKVSSKQNSITREIVMTAVRY